MTRYNKLWTVLGGLVTILAARYGIDLESPAAAFIIEALLAGATAAGVYFAPNTSPNTKG